jgi:hypothetical protein
MFHYDPGHAARTSRVFAKLDNQIDEWKKRFGPITATEDILAARRSREVETGRNIRSEIPHAAQHSGSERIDDSSSFLNELKLQIQWCRCEIEAAQGQVKQQLGFSNELVHLKSEAALLRQESSETKRRCDQLELTLREVMRTVSTISAHQAPNFAPQADRNVSLSVPELLSLVGSGGVAAHVSSKPQSGIDEIAASSLRERIANIEDRLSTDSTKIDRLVDSVTAKVIDALREELLMTGARPKEVQSRVSARVISQLHDKIPVSAALHSRGIAANTRIPSDEYWSFGSGRKGEQINEQNMVSKVTIPRDSHDAQIAKHLESERRDSQRREIEQNESDKRDLELWESELREAARLDAERAEALKREADRAEALKREADRAEALKREADRAEALKRDADRAEALKRDADGADAQRRDADRHESKILDERRQAEQREIERLEQQTSGRREREHRATEQLEELDDEKKDQQHHAASSEASVHDFDAFDVNSEDFEGGVEAQAVQDIEDEDAVDSSDDSELPLPGSVTSIRGTTATASNVEEKPRPTTGSSRVASSRGLANFLSRPIDDDEFGADSQNEAPTGQPLVANSGISNTLSVTAQPKSSTVVRSTALRDFSDDFDF